MNALAIINKYYSEENELKHILLTHSRSVADKALQIAVKHPELHLDTGFHPYICHGYLGSELLMKEGYPRHALVCERHTGAGMSLQSIIEQDLPIPHRDMVPVSMEEQVICFADKFFSKTHLDREKSVEKALKSISRYGEDGVIRFKHWCECFL